MEEESTTTNEHPATDDKTRSNMSTEELEQNGTFSLLAWPAQDISHPAATVAVVTPEEESERERERERKSDV